MKKQSWRLNFACDFFPEMAIEGLTTGSLGTFLIELG